MLKQPGEWTPFLERLEPNEFLAVEHTLGGTLSDNSELVIYRASGRETSIAIALARTANKGSRLEVTFDPTAVEPRRKVIPLPADIADRLLAAMELALTKQLYPPTGNAFHYPEERSDFASYWLNLRINKSVSIAGVVLTGRCGVGQESKSPFLEIMGCIVRLAKADRVENEMLTELDLAISTLRLSYPLKR